MNTSHDFLCIDCNISVAIEGDRCYTCKELQIRPSTLPKITMAKFKNLILDILAQVDYDIYKQYNKETAEMPEEVGEYWEDIINVASKHLEIT